MTELAPVYNQSGSNQCVICGTPLNPYTQIRKIPDYLDLKCYRTWEHALDEPWLKKLMNMERSRRQKRQRLAKKGIYIEEVSLDQMIEAGMT